MAFNAFTEDNPTFVGLSEGALRPLINEQNPDIKAEAKQKIGAGHRKKPTAKDVRYTEDNPTMVGVSERALRPLIREQDPNIQAEAKQKIVTGVTSGHPMGAVNTDIYNIALKAYC